MSYTAADVKKLREATQAGMMDCKKALDEVDGDFDKAIEYLRVKGAVKAAERAAERETAVGVVATSGNALISLLCETDFVAKTDQFVAGAQKIADIVAGKESGDIEQVAKDLGVTVGEKVEIGGTAKFDGTTTVYLHKKAADLPPALGVLIEYTGDQDTARKAAMQGASMKAKWLTIEDVPADVVASEKDVLTKKTLEEGKPEAAVAKIVEGRIGAFFKENVLLEQEAFVFDSKDSVAKVLAAANTSVTGYARLEA